MNKKAFVLMETIVVIVVISVALLTIFASYNKILSKVKSENKFDTSEYIYMTKYIRDYLKNTSNGVTVTPIDLFPCDLKEDKTIENCNQLLEVTNYYNRIKSNNSTIDNFNVKGIYVLSDINNFDKLIDLDIDGEKDSEEYNNSEVFDGYMIDYIRKLDIGDNDTILVVEYKRPAIKMDGSELKDYVGGIETNQLYETYIASLEW